MGRKLTAVRVDRKSEPRGRHKRAPVTSSKKQVSKAFRVDYIKSARESSEVHQIYSLRGDNIICGPSDSMKSTQESQRNLKEISKKSFFPQRKLRK